MFNLLVTKVFLIFHPHFHSHFPPFQPLILENKLLLQFTFRSIKQCTKFSVVVG
jgi:hypothetical protein